jgi:WD40 repeat protein/predicted  nucleic acid-binding Zn-ribbon protein
MKRFVFTFSLAAIAIGSSLVGNAQEAPAKVNFEDHIKPIFRDHCLSCHNANDKKGGLALDSFASTMEGGSGGEIVVEGDLDSSRLWELTAHVGQPYMPPNQEKIAESKLNLLKAWIQGGMLENSGSTAKKKMNNVAVGSFSLGKPDELPMPQNLLMQPVVASSRAAAISALAASPWSPLVAVGGQKQVALYHSETGELLGILPFPEGEPQSISFSRDGRLVLVGGGRHSHSGCAILFDVKTGQRVAKVGDELDIVLSADLSEDNSKIAVAGPQKMVRVYSTTTGELMWEVKKHTDWIYAVRFSPDGVLLASADRSNGLIVWEADTGRLYMDLLGHRGEIRQLAWRPDGNVLASASLDGTIRLWEMNEGKQIKQINAHGGGATSLAFAQNGNLVSGGRDRLVKVWNTNGDAIKNMPAISEVVLEVGITADPARVIGGDWNGNVTIWSVDDPNKSTVIAANPLPLNVVLQQRQASFDAITAEAAPLASAYQDLATKVAAMETEMATQDAALKAATEASAKAQADLKPLSEMMAAMTQRMKELETILATAKQVQVDLNGKLAAATDESAKQTLQGLLAPANQKVTETETEIAKVKPELDAVVAKITPLQEEVKNQEAKRVAATQAVEAIKAALPGITDQRNKAQQANDAAQGRLAAAKAQLEKATAALANFESTAARLKSEAEQLGQQAAAAEKVVVETKAQRDASVAKMTEMNTALAALQQQMDALKKQMDEMNAAKGQQDTALKAVEATMSKLQAELDQVAEKNSVAQEQFKVFSEAYGKK